MYTVEELQKKLDVLREEYKNAKESDKKLISIRGKLYKRQLESLTKGQQTLLK